MRILVTGVVLFVIWCIVSAWLYNDKLIPVMKKPAAAVTIPQPLTSEADSLARLRASIPKPFTVYFEFSKAEFKPDQQTDNSLALFKTWLEKYQGSMLYITGHSDLVGTPEYNEELGMKRATAVGKYAEQQGIPQNRIIAGSKGESQPAADYLTEQGRSANRRTEISIQMQ